MANSSLIVGAIIGGLGGATLMYYAGPKKTQIIYEPCPNGNGTPPVCPITTNELLGWRIAIECASYASTNKNYPPPASFTDEMRTWIQANTVEAVKAEWANLVSTRQLSQWIKLPW